MSNHLYVISYNSQANHHLVKLNLYFWGGSSNNSPDSIFITEIYGGDFSEYYNEPYFGNGSNSSYVHGNAVLEYWEDDFWESEPNIIPLDACGVLFYFETRFFLFLF